MPASPYSSQPRQQGFGVGNHLFPLVLVARQVLQPLGVGVAHRHQFALVAEHEHMVAGKHPIAQLAHLGQPGLIGGGQPGGVAGPPGQEGQPLPLGGGQAGGQQQVVQAQGRQLFQELELGVQSLLQHRGQCPPGGPAGADVFALQHRRGQVFAEVVGVGGKEDRFKPARRLAHRLAPRPGGKGLRQAGKGGDHRVFQQAAKDGQARQPGAEILYFHQKFPHFRQVCWNPYHISIVHPGKGCKRTVQCDELFSFEP